MGVNSNKNIDEIGSYLAGLIEGDGTSAIHKKDLTAKKYSPMIIVVFNKSNLPLGQYLKILLTVVIFIINQIEVILFGKFKILLVFLV